MAFRCIIIARTKPIDNKPSLLSAATWPLETETKNLSALPCKYVQVRCRNSHIKTGKRSEFIIIIMYHVRLYVQQQTLPLCVQLLLLWSRRHISVAVDMRTLLDRIHLSSRTSDQVAARRVTGLIIKALIMARISHNESCDADFIRRYDSSDTYRPNSNT